MSSGLILYGAPATGKDTVTAALSRLDPRYRLFERLKSGTGRTVGYRMTDDAELDHLEEVGLLVWANTRYGARYAIDRPGLDELIASDVIPVIHAGQPQVIDAVRDARPDVEWTVVQLRCDADTAQARIIARQTGDVAERVATGQATPPINADLTIDTDSVDPDQAAQTIRAFR
ncbi:hypothetical protein [Nocardia salmonicida]|uniref:hypothetical protein n=1 Tax=Nocardia salmonicida TaxID=53431 RepID=UPI0007A50F23|nr:hypothetical protein [Nocardia salmonicida]